MGKKLAQLVLCALVGGVPVWALPPACRLGPYWKDALPQKVGL